MREIFADMNLMEKVGGDKKWAIEVLSGKSCFLSDLYSPKFSDTIKDQFKRELTEFHQKQSETFDRNIIYTISKREKVEILSIKKKIFNSAIIKFRILNKKFKIKLRIGFSNWKIAKDGENFFFIVKDRQKPILFNLNTLLDMQDLNSPLLNDFNEILYVGQTSQVWKRPLFDGHKKLSEIEREYRDKDIIVHFFSFKITQLADNLKFGLSLRLNHGYSPVLPKKESSELCERILMNYFDPPYNRDSTEKQSALNILGKIFEDEDIEEILFAFAFRVSHNYWSFGSKVIENSSEHYIKIGRDEKLIEFINITYEDYNRRVLDY